MEEIVINSHDKILERIKTYIEPDTFVTTKDIVLRSQDIAISYTVEKTFRAYMRFLIEVGKAKKVGNGQYYIFKEGETNHTDDIRYKKVRERIEENLYPGTNFSFVTAWKICRDLAPFYFVLRVFNHVMKEMIKQGRVVKQKKDTYYIQKHK